jgi:hypothetical protein
MDKPQVSKENIACGATTSFSSDELDEQIYSVPDMVLPTLSLIFFSQKIIFVLAGDFQGLPKSSAWRKSKSPTALQSV